MGDWRDWIGRSATQSDVLTPALVRRHRATFDARPDDLAPLPGIHWCLCLPDAVTSALGEDGHPRREGGDALLPPIPLPRRMWASSEVEFLAPIVAGAAVERGSRIVEITEKRGGSGALAFVTVEHSTAADGIPAVRETQTLVFREAARKQRSSSAHPAPISHPSPAPPAGGSGGAWSHRRVLTPCENLLFRFSALTFNSHRIHYDLPYARDVEGYRGLVVHGPLMATLLLGFATDHFGPVRHFAFRALSPAFVGEPLTLVARQEGATFTLAALGPDGSERVTASASI